MMGWREETNANGPLNTDNESSVCVLAAMDKILLRGGRDARDLEFSQPH